MRWLATCASSPSLWTFPFSFPFSPFFLSRDDEWARMTPFTLSQLLSTRLPVYKVNQCLFFYYFQMPGTFIYSDLDETKQIYAVYTARLHHQGRLRHTVNNNQRRWNTQQEEYTKGYICSSRDQNVRRVILNYSRLNSPMRKCDVGVILRIKPYKVSKMIST